MYLWTNGIFYEINQQNKFAGTAISKYKNGQLQFEANFKNRKIIEE